MAHELTQGVGGSYLPHEPMVYVANFILELRDPNLPPGTTRVAISLAFDTETTGDIYEHINERCIVPALRQAGLIYDWTWDGEHKRYRRWNPTTKTWEWQPVEARTRSKKDDGDCCLVM